MPGLAAKETLEPSQNVVEPSAEIVAKGAAKTFIIFETEAEHPL